MILRQTCPILLSYPRCGNSWLRFCIEFLSEQPTYPDNNFTEQIRKYININHEEYILRKEHSLFDNDNIDGYSIAEQCDIYKNVKLILLVRDYKECIMRQAAGLSDLIPIEVNEKHERFGLCEDGYLKRYRFNYIENFVEFENWPTHLRLLVYYEDLILNPQKTLEMCLFFLDISNEKIDQFVENYDYYTQLSIDAYGESVTKGAHFSYFSEMMSYEKQLLWDGEIKKRYPDIFDKYLTRYRTI